MIETVEIAPGFNNFNCLNRGIWNVCYGLGMGGGLGAALIGERAGDTMGVEVWVVGGPGTREHICMDVRVMFRIKMPLCAPLAWFACPFMSAPSQCVAVDLLSKCENM